MVTITRDRYVVLNVISSSLEIKLNSLKTTIWREFQRIYGISGSSSAGLYFEHFDMKKMSGIVRCTHDSLPSFLTILALITKTDETDVILYVSYISGVIKKAKKFLSG